MLKHCVICGAEFSAPPSANKERISAQAKAARAAKKAAEAAALNNNVVKEDPHND